MTQVGKVRSESDGGVRGEDGGAREPTVIH